MARNDNASGKSDKVTIIDKKNKRKLIFIGANMGSDAGGCLGGKRGGRKKGGGGRKKEEMEKKRMRRKKDRRG